MSEPATIRIFESELERIKDCVLGSPGIETGGELLGLWSHGDAPTVMLAGVTVVLAGGPAPDSRRGRTWFEQDPATHMELERLMWEEFGVQVVGLWHSHHELSLHELSDGDIQRTRQYSQRHGRPRYTEILAYILDGRDGVDGRTAVGLRPHVYEDASTGIALPTSLVVLPGESPIRRSLEDCRLGRNVAAVVGSSARQHARAAPHVVHAHDPYRAPHDSYRAEHKPVRSGRSASDHTANGTEASEEGEDDVERNGGPLRWLWRKALGGRQEGIEQEEGKASDPHPAAESAAPPETDDRVAVEPPRPTGGRPPAGRTPTAARDLSLLAALEGAVREMPEHAASRLVIEPTERVIRLRLPSIDGRAVLVIGLGGNSAEEITVEATIANRRRERPIDLGGPVNADELADMLTWCAGQMGYPGW